MIPELPKGSVRMGPSCFSLRHGPPAPGKLQLVILTAAPFTLPFRLVLSVDGVRLVEDVERFVEFVAGDFATVDVEAGEERAVGDTADGLSTRLVQLTSAARSRK